MRIFDTHTHIGLMNEDPIEQLIVAQETRAAGVESMISICNNPHDFFQVYENLKTATHVFHAIGVSPSEVNNPGLKWESLIEEAVELERVVAIGETGLDYYKKFGDRSSQIELFVRQLELASRFDLPVIIHNREAGEDVLSICRDKLPPRGGVLHCYSENWEYAQQALELNLFVSFAGNVTYRNARNLYETAKNIPLDRVVVESEAPFMVPAEYRGKRNQPRYILSTVEFLAELRGMGTDEISEILYENSLRLFPKVQAQVKS